MMSPITRRKLVLQLLRDAGRVGVTTSEFLHGGAGSRFGGRLHELRAVGHVIKSTHLRGGEWRYTLTFDAERGAGNPENPGTGCLSSRSGSAGSSLGAVTPEGARQGTGRPANLDDQRPLDPSSPPTSLGAPSPPLFDGEFQSGGHIPRPGYVDYDPEDEAA